ncbi:MAG: hypothetical protein AAF927_24290, partial [Bacteroidota bacterium]
ILVKTRFNTSLAVNKMSGSSSTINILPRLIKALAKKTYFEKATSAIYALNLPNFWQLSAVWREKELLL